MVWSKNYISLLFYSTGLANSRQLFSLDVLSVELELLYCLDMSLSFTD